MAIGKLQDYIKENQIDMNRKYTTQQIQDITWTNKQKKNLTRYQPKKKEEKGNFIVRTIATVDDALVNMSKGFLRRAEGWADKASYLIADVEDFFGADEWAERTREQTKRNLIDELYGNSKTVKAIKNEAYQNKYVTMVEEGVGDVLASMGGSHAIGLDAPGVSKGEKFTKSFLLTYESASGNAMSEALRNGADLDTARKAGVVHGISEAISEQFFDGLPIARSAGWGDNVIGKIGSSVEKYFGSKTGKLAMKALKASGEGFEEIISNMLTSAGTDVMHYIDRNYTYGMENQTGNIFKDTWNAMTSKESWDSFITATLTSAITNSGQTLISNTQKNNIIKSYAQENNMSVKQVKDMFNQTVQERTEYQKQQQPKMNLGEQVELEQQNKIRTLEELQKGTYVQPGTETQKYQYKETDNQKLNEMNKSLAEVANNTQLTRETAKTAERLVKDLGFNIKFTNNEQIQNQIKNGEIKAVDGANINGYVKNGTMYINVDSDQLANFTIGHETKHFFEANEELNNALNQSLKEYAQQKGVWDKMLAERTDLYTDKDGNLVGDPEGELLADLSGQFFADYDFVNNLSTKNPSLFQKTKDFFQKLYYKATGQQEKLLLKQINENFNKVYREYAKNKPDTNISSNEIQKVSQKEETKQEIKEKVESKEENVLPIAEKTEEKQETSIKEKNKTNNKEFQAIIYSPKTKSPVVVNVQGTTTNIEGIDVGIYKDGKNNWHVIDLESKLSLNTGQESKKTRKAAIESAIKNIQENDIDSLRKTQKERYKDIKEDKTLSNKDIQYSLSQDNKGRELTKEQQEYFKDSKARDENGNLEIVYHGSKRAGFTTFNTKDNVSFYTNDEGVANTYSGSNEKVDTRKLESIYDAKSWLKGITDELYIENNNVYDYDGNEILNFDSSEDLLRNLKRKIQTEIGNTEAGGIYEGYVNITNPYIIDAKGKNWNDITIGENQKVRNMYESLTKREKNSLSTLADKMDNMYLDYKEGLEGFYQRLNAENSNLYDKVTVDNSIREKLYQTALYEWNESSVDDLLGKRYSTNDIVQQVLDMNKNGSNYDGVIFNNIIDEGMFDGSSGNTSSVYVTFNPNQFKAADNISPTEDSDIRYSISREGQNLSEELDEFYSPKNKVTTRLSDLKRKEVELPIKEEKPVRLSKNEQKQANEIKEEYLPLAKNNDVLRVDAENIAKEINKTGDFDTTKQRKWIKSLKNSDAIQDKSILKDLDMSKLSYEVQTNQKSLDRANDYIESNGYENSLNHVKDLIRSEKTPTATDVALLQRMTQEAIKNKDYQTAQELIMDTAILGTDLGQAVQAMSIIQKLTPEGQLKLYTKMVNRAKIRGEKSFTDVEITPDMVETVLGAYNEDGTYDQEDLNSRVEKFKQDIATQMKSTISDKVNAWRYLSMLGNPKTHIRNVVSNIAMKGTIKAKNTLARTLETILPINERTKTFKKASKEIKSYAKDTAAEMKGIITGENKYNEKVALEQEKQIFKSKALEKISRFNSEALEAEDWFFSRSAFESNLSEYLTANNINTMEDIKNNPEVVEKAKIYAVQQAEIATFRQYSKLASEINRIERNGKLSKYAINAVLPFKKTPINVAKAGFNYSPLGLIKNISYDAYQLKQGNINGSQFIDNISQGLTGTSVALLGYALAKAGILSGGGDDDKEGKYDSQLGKQSYAINIGGKSYSISWLSPTGMPLLVGANLYEKLEEDKDWSFDVVANTLANTLDPMSEMSFLSSLTDVLKSYNTGGTQMIKSIGEAGAQSYILQFFPTLFGQLASTLDDTKRSTKASNNSNWKFGEETIRKIMLKVPGLRNQLEEQTDIWGNVKQQTDNIITRAVESFIAPYSKTEDITSDIDKEIKQVFNKTGETGVIPGIPQAYVKKDNETFKMSAKEYTQYKKTFGQTANTTITELFKNDSYKSADDDDKVRMIENAYKYAREQAKQEYFNSIKEDFNAKKSNKIKRIQNEYEINVGDYYANMEEYNYAEKNPEKYLAIKQVTDYKKYDEYKTEINKIKKEYNNKNQRKKAVYQYINSLPLSIEQKLILQKTAAGYSVKQYRRKLHNYINGLDLSAEDKKKIDKVLFRQEEEE